MHWNSPAHPEMQCIDGETRAVNRVFCIAKNYAEHAEEMGGEVDRKAPFHFQKSFDAVTLGPQVRYPTQTNDLHHEVELVAILGQGGTDLTVESARDAVFGYAVGIDFTRRDRQSEAKAQGRPWDMSKNFDDAAVLGAVTPVDAGNHPTTGAITLAVNGEIRQHGDLKQMAYNTFELIAYLSSVQILKPGDLIYTGTPAGVGAVRPGDTLHCQIDGLSALEVTLI